MKEINVVELKVSLENYSSNMIRVDWCTLPSDLLIAIALKLDSINDIIYFSAVCRSWNDVFTMVKKELNNSATPWLLLADPNPKNAVCSGRSEIFEINSIKGLELNIPQAYMRQYFGSAYGWIVMMGLGSDEYDRQVWLFNPITKAQLTLPSLASLPVLRNSSMSLRCNDEYPLMSKNDSLAVSRPGDRTWRWTKCMVNFSPSSPVYANKPYCSIVNPDFINVTLGSCEQSYMVELAGDLLLVIRYRAKDEAVKKHYYTCDFKVYKLDRSGDQKCWTIVEDLGDYMVFIGNNSSMSVHKSKSPNYQHNAIYFTDDIKGFWSEPKPRLQDIGMFDTGSREFIRFSKGNDKIFTTFKPLWFMPKF
ncbi:uncharacterized protein LOC110708930 [Chenopodium quinoa]|uniref:uncharacterized protein LOC110708930 n=1 Tax=Chenopodium quinoa TaxID=63459 RepID=UPI000B782B31|nr:uncharacterized protein LOC110708930 [Chenopodium quinoa]